MATRDADKAESVLMPGGSYVSVRRKDGQIVLGGGPHKAFLEQLRTGKGTLLERIWQPRVSVHGDIANVWTPYDFYRDGKFSHCGIDSFNLVRTPEGWKIAGFIYTLEFSGCEPSPLGPPAP